MMATQKKELFGVLEKRKAAAVVSASWDKEICGYIHTAQSSYSPTVTLSYFHTVSVLYAVPTCCPDML